jgi:hypothetical protein
MEGGLPTDATVAQVLVLKSADDLPLYRRTGSLERVGGAVRQPRRCPVEATGLFCLLRVPRLAM